MSRLGDSAERDYSRKLQQFNRFAEPELVGLIQSCKLSSGMQVLDAGCGSGEALNWLQREVGAVPAVAGIDLSAAHVAAARKVAPSAQIHHGDLGAVPLPAGSVDFIWCVNTLNHLSDPAAGLLRLKELLRAGGRIAVGQSTLLPEMYFAWDARLERLVNEAVRQYYRARYALQESDLSAVRALVGLLRGARFGQVVSRTIAIERIAPLDAATEAYLGETIFRDTWGERLRPYLSAEDFGSLQTLCNPLHAGYALRRPDFHFLQTFTLVCGQK